MNTKGLSLFFLVIFATLDTLSAVSPLINQVWWTKYTGVGKTEQIGCSNICCSGKDSNCYSSGPRMGGKTSSNGKCFCDEGCLDMQDCCEDYSVQCQAVDCVVGEWEEYGECTRQCGLGAKTRHRSVIQEPRNGGQECPVLKETTVCFGERCMRQRHIGRRGRVDLETARIMPATFGQYRTFVKYNAHLDIRKNLFYQYYAHNIPDRRGYCAMYEITSTRASCSSSSAPWASVLEEGQKICIECQDKAMDGSAGTQCKGHGSIEKDTFWTAVNAQGCHGWFRRINELSECSCNGNQGRDFIFV